MKNLLNICYEVSYRAINIQLKKILQCVNITL